MSKSKKGYFLAEAMIAIIIAGSIATVYVSMSYYTNMQANMMKHQNTKTILDVIRSRVIHTSADVDSDNFYEPLKEDNNTELPTQIGLGIDGWGKRIKYYSVDFNATNTNHTYADTNTSISPNSEIVVRLVSGGENLTIDTNETSSIAQEDDILLEISVAEFNSYKLVY